MSRKRYDEPYRLKNKDLMLKRTRNWRKSNKDKVKIYNQKYDKTHPDHGRRTNLKIKFNMSLEEYNKMWQEQDGKCMICHKAETATYNGILKILSVDHDHKTGKIRGLLCSNCNAMLGFVNDNPIILLDAIRYLEVSKL